MAAAISDAGIDAESIVFVAAAEQAMAIKLTAGPHFNYRVVSANITAGTVIAIATAGLAVAGTGIPVVDTSKSATLHFEDTTPLPIGSPGTPTVVAAPTRSLWQTDSFALRCIALHCADHMGGSAGLGRAGDRLHMVNPMDDEERYRRQRLIAELREANSAASAALDAEIVERAFARPVTKQIDVERAELAAFYQRLDADREGKRRHLSETIPAADAQEALEACGRALDLLSRENAEQHEQIAKLVKRIEALERAAQDRAETVERLLHQKRIRDDDESLPLPPSRLNH